MLNDMRNATIVKRGKCLYDGSLEYEVRILKWHIFYGTGDYEDPYEIREDRNIDCYYVYYEDLIRAGEFNAGGGVFLSVDEAVVSIESKTIVEWD